MQIKNYTSGIDASTTIAKIENKLVRAGASHINKTYDQKGNITALIFRIDGVNGKTWPVKVPANVQACFEALWKDHCRIHPRAREHTKSQIYDQAHRTAWKLVQDWVEVQVSMIAMRQAEFLEVFLPYVWDGQQTYFEAMKGGGFKQLRQNNETE